MRRLNSQIGRQCVLVLLLLGVLFTVPSAVTSSKYVWNEDIVLQLKIDYASQDLTSLSLMPNNPR